MSAELTDPYHQVTIANYIRLPYQVIGGGMIKVLLQLGDRFAVTCTMVMDDEERHDPKVVERICHALLFIFARAGIVDNPRDRYPIYSVFFLEKLRITTRDDSTRALIEATLQFLNSGVVELANGRPGQMG